MLTVRPSRYTESDQLGAVAQAEFAGISGAPDLLAAVSSWVGTQLRYVPGSSGPGDGAVQTLLRRQGVCRDYAYLVVALLRALNVPARLAAVYAPGLEPMDFHAVAEAVVDGCWRVVDATLLAPRQPGADSHWPRRRRHRVLVHVRRCRDAGRHRGHGGA